MSTIVHEQTHQWQYEYGENYPKTGSYHNKEWVNKMESIGLIPSHNFLPGGRKTGKRVGHYILEEGAFKKAFEAMPSEFLIPWLSFKRGNKDKKDKQRTDKIKYSCPGCGVNVWGKAQIAVVCRNCNLDFVCMAAELN